MAEEDFDDDLDIGDDLSDDDDLDLDDSLDDLGGDDLDDDGDDTELDSFFEDLSSIDDISEEEQGDEPAEEEEVSAPAAAPTPAAEAPTVAETSSSGSKKWILYLIGLLILGAGGYAGYWFFSTTDPIEEIADTGALTDPLDLGSMDPGEGITIEEETKTPPPVITKPVKKAKPKKVVVEPPPPKPREIPPPTRYVPRTQSGRYLIQVASCKFPKCTKNFVRELRNNGFPVYTSRDSAERFSFVELLSKQVYNESEAYRLVQVINEKNRKSGYASIKAFNNGYRVTMGSFPALDRAKEVKHYIEKMFPGGDIVFAQKHIEKKLGATQIYAGPYGNSSEAREVLAQLRRINTFNQAFITRRR